MGRVAYLFPAFPVFHQTFVLWEVLGVQRNGVDPLLYSLRPGTEKQQPEGQEISRRVNYLPGLFGAPIRRANWRRLVREPGRYLGLYLAVIRAWRTGVQPVRRDDVVAGSRATTYNRLRGWINGHPFPYLLKSLALVPTAVYLAERLQAEGVTHLHVHWATYPATVAYVVHELCGLPFSISAHAYDIYMTQRMLPAKIAAAEFVSTCARTNQEFLARVVGPQLSEKIRVIYHGVDTTRFRPASHETRTSGTFTVASCGQLERYKGMHLLIEACATLLREGLPVRCWIVGEGPERSSLERQIEALGVTKQIELLGARPHAEIAERLSDADAFALASELTGRSRRRDVIANVIVEAMAAGLPVVASSIPGVEELIDDGQSGYLIPPNEVQPLIDALRRLATHPEERARLGKAARRRVLEEFDSAMNVRQLADILRQAAVAQPAVSDNEKRRAGGAV